VAFGTPVRQLLNSTKTAGTTLSATGTLAANIAAGDLILMLVAADNVQTTDGNTTLISSVTLTVTGKATTTLSRAREFTNGQGAAAAGATVALWYAVAADSYTTSDGVTWAVNFASSIAAKACLAFSVTKGATTGIAVDGGTDLAVDAAAHPAIALGGLANVEHLFLQAWADEGPFSTAPTVTNGSSLSAANGTSGGSTATNMSVSGGYRVFTGTSNTMTCTLSNVDAAAVYVAFSETVAGANLTQGVNDTLTLADADSEEIGKNVVPADTVTLADALVKDVGEVQADAVAVADAQTKDIGEVQADSITVADSSAQQVGKDQQLVDTATLADSVSNFDYGWGVTDTASLSDSATTLWVAQLTINDAAGLADAQVKDIGETQADTVALTDSNTQQVGRDQQLADTLTLADALNLDFGKNLVEALALADAQVKDVGKQFAEAIVLTDVTSMGVTTLVTDTAALADALSMADSIIIADAAALTDAQVKDIAKSFAEALALADAQANTIQVFRADTLSLADGVAEAVGYALSLSDAATLADVATPFMPSGGFGPDLTGPLVVIVAEQNGTAVIVDYAGAAAALESAQVATEAAYAGTERQQDYIGTESAVAYEGKVQ
jgi:hypothetical protein